MSVRHRSPASQICLVRSEKDPVPRVVASDPELGEKFAQRARPSTTGTVAATFFE